MAPTSLKSQDFIVFLPVIFPVSWLLLISYLASTTKWLALIQIPLAQTPPLISGLWTQTNKNSNGSCNQGTVYNRGSEDNPFASARSKVRLPLKSSLFVFQQHKSVPASTWLICPGRKGLCVKRSVPHVSEIRPAILFDLGSHSLQHICILPSVIIQSSTFLRSTIPHCITNWRHRKTIQSWLKAPEVQGMERSECVGRWGDYTAHFSQLFLFIPDLDGAGHKEGGTI